MAAELNLVQQYTFSGDLVSVLKATGQGTDATTTLGTNGTVANNGIDFVSLLTGLIAAQIGTTPGLTADAATALIQTATAGATATGTTAATAGAATTTTPAKATTTNADVNNLLTGFYDLTPSGVPLPSQKIQVSTLPQTATTTPTTNPNATTTTTTPTTTAAQLEALTQEQLRVARQTSQVNTQIGTTPATSAPILPVVNAPLPNPDGTVLAKPPQSDDVKSRISEIGAVAPAVTGLTPSLDAGAKNAFNTDDQTIGSRISTSSSVAFALPQETTAPVASSNLTPTAIAAPTTVTSTASSTVTTASVPPTTLQTVPPVATPVAQPQPVVPTTTNVTVAPVQTQPVTVQASANPVATTTVTSAVPTAPRATIPASANSTPTASASVGPQTARSTGIASATLVITGVEANGKLPTANLIPQSTQILAPSLIDKPTERRTEIAADATANSPTLLTGGDTSRPTQTTSTSATQTSQTPQASHPTPVLLQTADALVREARLTQTPGESEFRLRLQPATLGEIRVSLRSTAEGVTAQLTVANDGVRQMIENQLPELRQRLADAGVTVNGFHVSADAGSNRGHSGSRYSEANVEEMSFAPASPVNRQPTARPSASRAGLDVTA